MIVRRFFAWLARLDAPAIDLVPTAPAPPAVRAEQFADRHAQVQAEAAYGRRLAARICAVNNANVTRDYGLSFEDQSRRVIPMSNKQLADAGRLLGVTIEAPRKEVEHAHHRK